MSELNKIILYYGNFYYKQRSSVFVVNSDLKQRIKAGEFGDTHGLSVSSTPGEIKDEKLVVITEIKLVAITSSAYLDVAVANFVSEFEFEDPEMLLKGESQEAINIIIKCFHLAQAQSYSVFFLLSVENKLPKLPMELTPNEKLIDTVKEFLSDNKSY